MRPFLVPILAFLAVLWMASPAHAQPTASQRATAEALFNAGKKLLDEGNYAEACKKFEASQELDAGVGTILYLGACYEKLGKTASAWAAFRQAASVASAGGQPDRAEVAQDRADRLEPELVRITIAVPTENRVDGLVVNQDGAAVLPATFGVPTPVDPGSHKIEASAPGYETWRSTVVIPVGSGTQTINLPPLKKLAEPATPPPVAPPPPTPQPAAPPPATAGPDVDGSSGDGQRVAAAVVGGIGVVGLAIGTVFAVVASGKNGDADDICEEDNACSTAEGVQLSEDARSAGNIATVGFAVGAVAIATAVVLFLTAPSGDDSVAQGGTQHAASGIWESLTLSPAVGLTPMGGSNRSPDIGGAGLWLEGKLP